MNIAVGVIIEFLNLDTAGLPAQYQSIKNQLRLLEDILKFVC